MPDLARDDRFPAFAPAALDAGLAAVFTFPLRDGDGRLGALDLYRDTAGDAGRRTTWTAAQTLADVAAAYLLNAQARDDARRATDQFRHGALHDPLTGLPNRVLLQQRLEHAAQRARRSHTNAAVLFVDLDRFKQVNDTHGHQVGDELLLAVAQRLTGLVRPGDTLARVSGDEFVFLCEDLTRPSDVEALARRVDEAFAEPFVLEGVRDRRPAPASAWPSPVPGEDISERAGRRGRHRDVPGQAQGWRPAPDHRPAGGAPDRRLATSLETRPAHGVRRRQRWTSPTSRSCAPRTALVTGVEALLRWTDPSGGRSRPCRSSRSPSRAG